MKKWLLFCLFLICYRMGYSQTKPPFNCIILRKIIQKIDSQRSVLEMQERIEKECFIFFSDKGGNDSVVAKNNYKDDKLLDSLLKSKHLQGILDARFDSLFFLSKTNVILDTFRFFTPVCSFKTKGRRIIVVNDYNKLKKYKGAKILFLSSLDNSYPVYLRDKDEFEDFSFIKFKNFNKINSWSGVMFLYSIKENVSVMEGLKVVRQSDF